MTFEVILKIRYFAPSNCNVFRKLVCDDLPKCCSAKKFLRLFLYFSDYNK